MIVRKTTVSVGAYVDTIRTYICMEKSSDTSIFISDENELRIINYLRRLNFPM